jgi:hypothetical protein
LTGSTGDVLKGGAGNDSFFAQDENTGLIVAYGEEGNDRFYLEGDLFIAKGAAGNDVYIVHEGWDGVGISLDFDLANDLIRIEEFAVNEISFFKDDNDNLAMKFDTGGELHFNNIDYQPGYVYADFNIYEYAEPNT